MLKSGLVAFFIVLGMSVLVSTEVFADQVDQRLKIKIIDRITVNEEKLSISLLIKNLFNYSSYVK